MSVSLETLLLFIPIVLALNLTPGADMMFCLGQGLRGGVKAGWAASIGISTGSLVHVVLAGLGLAALVAANPLLFEGIRWAGVIYLIWLAIQAFRADDPFDVATGGQDGVFFAWRDGIIVNLSNPKVAIFVLALIPQFVDPARGQAFAQFFQLGLVLVIGGTLINGFVGMGAGQIRRLLQRRPEASRWIGRTSGYIFLALAAKLVFERR